jgi:hypothetical protein
MRQPEPEFLERRMSAAQLSFVREVLDQDSEEDRAIDGALGRRPLSQEEREHVRVLLSAHIVLGSDGTPTPAGVAADDIIGLLRYY